MAGENPNVPTRRELRAATPRARRTRQLRVIGGGVPQRRHRQRGALSARRPLGIVAMALTGLLAATYAIPAMAYSGEPGDTVVSSASLLTSSQRVQVANVAGVTIQRDGYRVSTVQERIPGAYAQTAPTFTNNPSSPIQWPFLTGVPISDGFGPRIAPCPSCSVFHQGIDMNPGNKTPIQIIADGVVREVSAVDRGGLGVYAIIDHRVNGTLVSSLYAHMLPGSLSVQVGDRVQVGQQVGQVGNSGQSTGPHLHLGILLGGTQFTDPVAWLKNNVTPR